LTLYLGSQSCDTGAKIKYWLNADFPGNDFDTSVQSTVALCMEKCLANAKCQAFTYDNLKRFKVNCWLKSKAANYNMNYNGLTSGMRCSHAPKMPSKTRDGQYPLDTFPGKNL